MVEEYIGREVAKKAFRNGEHPVKWAIERGAKTFGDAFALILDEIPAADVVPVVRCRDCAHWWDPQTKPHGWCSVWAKEVENPEYFCADGEEKEG